MTLIVGTNCGFVTTAPTADPVGNILSTADDRTISQKDTTPSGTVKITEIGWWAGTASEEANFEVGIYSDNSDALGILLSGASRINAKGLGIGWKVATGLDIPVDADTDYWIAFQLDNTAIATRKDRQVLEGSRSSFWTGETTLQATGGGSYSTGWVNAIYAVVEEEEAASEISKVKMGGSFSPKPAMVKVGGTFVEKTMMVKVSGTFQ